MTAAAQPYQGPPPVRIDYPTSPHGVPTELAELRHWVAWQWERRDGKWTKPPVSPHTGRAGNCNDPSTWGTFTDATAWARRHGLPGIGVQLTEDMGIVGVDLDKCRDPETGAIDEWALAIVRRLDTFTQISPTGTGLRAFVGGRSPAWFLEQMTGERTGRKSGHIEVYHKGRYLTVTSGHLDGTPETIEDRQGALEAWLAEVWPSKASETTDARFIPPAGPVRLEDAELLERMFAASNGAAIRDLWSGGGGNASSGDQALLNHLAFWADRDATRMARLFEQSSRRREKWDRRPDYRERTIAKAIADCREGYRGPSSRYDPASEKAPTPPPPPDATVSAAGDGSRGPDGFALSDTGNAERMLAAHGKHLRYCAAWRKWLVWDRRAGCWVEDAGDCRVKACARKVVRQMAMDAAILAQQDKKAAKKLFDYALHCENASRLAAMVTVACSFEQVWVTPDELDANPWVLNCRNGTVNLKTGLLRPHNPDDLLTRVAPVDYDHEAECPVWERFVASVTAPADGIAPTPDGDKEDGVDGDPAMAEYLQRAIGHSLTGDQSEQVVYFPYGKGSNGKSTFLNTIKGALGDYAMQAPDSLLLVKRGESHPTELADLYRKRLVVSTEVEDGRRLAEALVKQLTGGERIRARRMREDFWEYDPTHTVWVAANHKPEIRGTDHAIWRRIRLVPFDRTFYDADKVPPGLKATLEAAGKPLPIKDTGLPAALHAELHGILAWAVRGCVAWGQDGINVPERVQKATDAYRVEMDVLASFIDDRCELNPQGSTLATPLYEAYVAWCTANGEKSESQRKFGDRLGERGFTKDRAPSGHIVRVGLQLRETAAPQPGGQE